MQNISFRNLCWRYLTIGWLLSPSSSDLFQGPVDRRTNRQKLCRWLPLYIRRHATLMFLCAISLTLAVCVEDILCECITAVACGFEFTVVLGLSGLLLAVRLGERANLND